MGLKETMTTTMTMTDDLFKHGIPVQKEENLCFSSAQDEKYSCVAKRRRGEREKK